MQPSELSGTKVTEYLEDKKSPKRSIAIEDVFIREDGSIVSVAGRSVRWKHDARELDSLRDIHVVHK